MKNIILISFLLIGTTSTAQNTGLNAYAKYLKENQPKS